MLRKRKVDLALGSDVDGDFELLIARSRKDSGVFCVKSGNS